MTNSKMKKLCCIFLFILVLIQGSTGLKCYTCSVTEDDADTTCETDPASVTGGVTDCDKKYCIIVRLDYKDPRGKLQSMTRTCADKPTYLNEVIEDETHRAYYRSCRTDLCNMGSGRADNNNEEGGNLGDKSTIYVPGVGPNSAVATAVSMSILIITCAFTYFVR